MTRRPASWSPALLAVAACASPPARPPASSADVGAWVSEDEPTPARSSVLSPSRTPLATAPQASVPRTIAAREDAAPRPRRGARVDVSLQKADMTNAFQFLADAGRFNLVMQEGLHAQVSATMRGVDPYDALLALAEANGVEVRYERDVVVVKKR